MLPSSLTSLILFAFSTCGLDDQWNIFSILIIWKLWIIHLTSSWYLMEYADLDFLFHMFFLARYCKLLEENSFRGRTADFFYMLLFGASVLTGIVLLGGMIPYLSESFAKIIFLSNSLTFMMVSYILCFFFFCWVLVFKSTSNSKPSFIFFRFMYGANRTPLFTWAS